MTFPGTPYTWKPYGKSELANTIGISPSTLRRHLHRIEDKLENYQRTDKILYPYQIEVYLIEYGYISPPNLYSR